MLIAMVASVGPSLHAEDNGGQLKRARDEVRPAGSSSSRPDHGSSHHHHHDDDGGGLFGFFFGSTSSNSPPTPVTYSSSNGASDHEMLPYPYADGQSGFLIRKPPAMLPDPADPTKLVPNTKRTYPVGAVLRAEYTDGGDGLNRYAVAGQATFVLLRIEAEGHRYIEHLDSGATDTLTLGTLGIAVALPAHDSITMLIGGGGSWYHDHYGNENGWYLKLGTEIFPIRPLVVSADVWGGFIRDDEFDDYSFLGGGRATLGVIWNRFELYGGWQATWIESVTLDGPTGGIRVWF
ncbi:MAG: hypothetical protein H0W78_19490 [Planctomycetes bacterium]|nr:hypothetical protein [Planctomycetota bacterium]